MADKGPLFFAQYENREPCPCGQPLEEDDEVGYVDNVLSCKECWILATDDLGFG